MTSGLLPTLLADVREVQPPFIAALLIASALMASVNHGIAVAGFCVASVLALYMLWRIVRTPGDGLIEGFERLAIPGAGG